MSKKYKQKHDSNVQEEVIDNDSTLSKKELYDLEQKKKREAREKERNKNKKKSKSKTKKSKKTYKTNLAGRIFAIVMLVLMVGSVIATISYYFTSGGK